MSYDYDIEINKIRVENKRLSLCTRNQLIELYKEWSDITASATWIISNDRHIKDFCQWATTAPVERKRKYNAGEIDISQP